MRADRPQDDRQAERAVAQLGARQPQGRGDDDPRRILQPRVEPVAGQLQHLSGAVEHGPGPARLDADQLFQQRPGLVGLADRHHRQVVVGNRLGQRRVGGEEQPRDLDLAPLDHQLQRGVGHQVAGGDQHQDPEPSGTGVTVPEQPPGPQRQPLALQGARLVARQLEQGPELQQPRGPRGARLQRGEPLLDQGRHRDALERLAHESGRIGGRDRL